MHRLLRFALISLLFPYLIAPAFGQYEHRVYIKPETTDLVEYGWQVAISNDILAVWGFPDTILLDPPADTVFIYREASPGEWIYSTAISAPTDDLDAFGAFFALDDDTLVIAAPREDSAATGINGDQSDNSAEDSGAVYVYTRTGLDDWSMEAYIKPINTDAMDFFGSSVALDGDTLVVGVPREASSATGVGGNPFDNSLPSAGAAYVFQRNAGTWSQQAYLKSTAVDQSAAEFGNAVAIDGDWVAVGAWFQTVGSSNFAGAVYTYQRNGVNWEAADSVFAPTDRDASDLFGSSVALSTRGSDGELLLAVGAPGDDSAAVGIGGDASDDSAESAGAVHLFSSNGVRDWLPEAYIKGSNTGEDDRFGTRLALTAGPRPRLVVGAFREDSLGVGVDAVENDNSAPQSGAAYVFQITRNSIRQQHYLKAINTDSGDFFGFAVDADAQWIAVGAPGEASGLTGIGPDPSNNSDTPRGAVYLLELPDRIFSDRLQ